MKVIAIQLFIEAISSSSGLVVSAGKKAGKSFILRHLGE